MSNNQQQTPKKIVAGYALHQRLGSGSFAIVYKGLKTSQSADGADTVAIKAITRASEKLTKKVLQNLEIEISILRNYRHRNIVCLQDVQKTERHFYLILEYCGGGDLQKLIRGRKAGRLTERLTRRLMRDLSFGLKFLWGQELIHRDIKPQNLLLTGPLPLDEVNDPEKSQMLEDKRRMINFPSEQFTLKIADFGFARHLQTTSLAETLCGSPLYMAPEILQHQRYDAKADLWSVGTVLFEMISGHPPFDGENHIDLLRNMQRKAVRLPADVKVSPECVDLLRLLLNRNPVSRAGFKEFFDACDAFVALGCEGIATEETGNSRRPTTDLGTIPENENDTTSGTESMMTVQTAQHQPQQQQQQRQQQHEQSPVNPDMHHPFRQHQQQKAPMSSTPPMAVSPPFPPPPSTLIATPHPVQNIMTKGGGAVGPRGLTPLQASPPSFAQLREIPQPMSRLPALPSLDAKQVSWQQQQQQQQNLDTSYSGRRNDGSPLQNSSDDSGFVMVEHGSAQRTDTQHSPQSSEQPVTAYRRQQQHQDGRTRLESSPPQSPRYYFNSQPTPVVTSRGDYMVVNDAARRVPKGILSTSPGTGGALMGLIGGMARLSYDGNNSRIATATANSNRREALIGSAANMLAAAEDVGRRAVSVAHLGDTRAYLALRFAFMNTEDDSSILSVTPMEGVEEESPDSGNVTDDSSSTEVAATSGRRVSISADKTMTDVKAIQEEEAEEMPFAISPDTLSTVMAGMPSRSSISRYSNKSSNFAGSQQVVKPTSTMIRTHLSEALSCYVKGLKMLKGSLVGVRQVETDLSSIVSQGGLSNEQNCHMQSLQKRCEVISNWLSGQFQGVLDRADAANVEIGKVPPPQQSPSEQQQQHQEQQQQHQEQQQQQQQQRQQQTSTTTDEVVTSVEELIYNHALSSGREGAVKQLLGQYEAARSCYRSAGLLAETLLMEANLGSDDRNILEGYVDGFAARITELDGILLQQSRQAATLGSSSNTTSSGSPVGGPFRHRGSGIVGLIGQPTQIPATFSNGRSSP